MKKVKNNTVTAHQLADNEPKITLPGYPMYPASEDIYSKFKEEVNIDPENIDLLKEPNEIDPVELRNEKDFDKDPSGSDLDIPGAELDDAQEATGNEDEENNYYSIGGDNHNDLEEGQGDPL